MEEQEDNMPSSPFWLNQSNRRRNRRRSSPSSSSVFLNTGFLLVFLLLIAGILIFFVIPSFLSFTSHVFKPHSVKKSWDSLNLVLVLFAIICGFLGNTTAPSPAATPTSSAANEERGFFESRSNPSTPQRFWNNYNNNYRSLGRLRSFNSYPDLRQDSSLWMSKEDDYNHNRWRFYDDTHVYGYRPLSSDDQDRFQFEENNEKEKEKEQEVVDDVQNVSVDTGSVVESQKEVVYTPPPPPPPPPPPQMEEQNEVVRRGLPRPYQDLGKREKSITQYHPPPSPPPPPRRQQREQQSEVVRRRVKRSYQHQGILQQQAQTPPRRPLSPPSPPPVYEERSQNERKRAGTSATKDFLNSFRRNKKKKKQRQKSVENLDSFFNYESYYTLPTPTIPPPPPPPPPFFHSLFSSKKGKKSKKTPIPVPPPPPPPPPPAASRKQKIPTLSASKIVPKTVPITTQKRLPVPVRVTNYNKKTEDNVSSGGESPLSNIPPPPPLPPFSMPPWKFEVHGDYVSLKNNEIRGGTGTTEVVDDDGDDNGGDADVESSSPSNSAEVNTDGGDSTLNGSPLAASPLFCPSPDVNTKADNFIARFRAGLVLEKMNSVKEKSEGRRRSNLGPGPASGPSYI